MSKLVAVQDRTFKYETNPSGSVELVVQVAAAASKVSSGGNKAHSDKIIITVVSGTVNLDSTPPSPIESSQGVVPPGTIQIDGTSEKARTGGKNFVLKGDEGEADFMCVFPADTQSGTAPYKVTIKAIVDDTNQNVLKVT